MRGNGFHRAQILWRYTLVDVRKLQRIFFFFIYNAISLLQATLRIDENDVVFSLILPFRY